MPFPEYRLSDGRTYTFSSDMTEEAATSLACEILSAAGCSFEILWPHEAKERDHLALQRAARVRAADKGQEWFDNLRNNSDLGRISPEIESIVQQAFLAGWRAAPRGIREIKP